MLFIISSSDNSKERCSFLDLFHKDKLVNQEQGENVSRHPICSAYPMDEFELFQGNEHGSNRKNLHILLFSLFIHLSELWVNTDLCS